MCEYIISEPNKLPICKYTKDKCTLCVLGNAKTYKEANEKNKENNNGNL